MEFFPQADGSWLVKPAAGAGEQIPAAEVMRRIAWKLIPQGDGSYVAKPSLKPPGREKISVKEAAERSGASTSTIYRLLDSGFIQGVRESERKTFIFADSLAAHQAATRDPKFWTEVRCRRFSSAI